MGSDAHTGRIDRWRCRRGGGRARAARARLRRRRLDPHSGELLRTRRAETDVRAGALYPAAGAHELVAHVCPLARTVRDVGLMMNVIARYDRRDPFALPDDRVDYLAACDQPLTGGSDPIRVAWSEDLGFAPVESETRAICAAAARALADGGLKVEEATPELGDPGWILVTLYGGGQAGAHAARSPEQKAQMDPELGKSAEAAAGLTVIDYVRAIAARQALVDTLRRFFERYDLLITPTVCLPAFSLGIVGPR